jgi:3-methyladenine DNA glycosylase AlkD
MGTSEVRPVNRTQPGTEIVITLDESVDQLRQTLNDHADPVFAKGAQRYFPNGVMAIGVPNPIVVRIADDFARYRPNLEPEKRLSIASELIRGATHHEEVLLGFAMLHKVAKRMPGEDLFDHCRLWLEEVVTNWAQCDDLCLKLLYPYFLGHLDMIPKTQHWIDSGSTWARRAANVAVVKFVRRQVGREIFELPLNHVFNNCTRLMYDQDEYVQKGSGWLLKVTAQVHPDEVSTFLRTWHTEMRRDTFRYAIEKMDDDTRAALMGLPAGRNQ